jgi:D-alanine-D-alanine ligase
MTAERTSPGAAPSTAAQTGSPEAVAAPRLRPRASARAVFLIHNDAGDDPAEKAADEAIYACVESVEAALNQADRPVKRLLLRPPLSSAALLLENLPEGATVFNLFEGFPDDPASEVHVGLLLERLGLRATGCPPLAMHLGLHKDLCKEILRGQGLPAAPGLRIGDAGGFQADPPFPFPAFLKPAATDASHGIGPENFVSDGSAFRAQGLSLLRRFPSGVIVEPFLRGREFNCGVVETPDGPVPLPPSLVDYSGLPPGHPPVLTFDAKWRPESEAFRGTPTICPAPVEPQRVRLIQQTALQAFEALRCRGYARVDFREDGDGALHILEVNPNPDISEDAGLAKQARALGWDFAKLIRTVVAAAEEGPPWTSR